MPISLYNIDCRDVMTLFLAGNSIDSIVTDPPYGLGFMGKDWDHGVPSVEFWNAAFDVLKPGGYLLAFGGSRTYHRMASAIEDAGFEIRDQIMWIYGSGFPKSHNGEWGGTALKPAHEPICVARKPLIGTVEANWKLHGTGALNIDGCRVATSETLREGAGDVPCRHDEDTPRGRSGEVSAEKRYTEIGGTDFAMLPGPRGGDPTGRWPANIIHDGSDDVLAAFPNAKGQQGAISGSEPSGKTSNTFGEFAERTASTPRGDTGSAARFFYCAKASKSDRSEGLQDFTARVETAHRRTNFDTADNGYLRAKTERLNTHPTVKPTDLMAYLCRLVTPAGGVVLDPFMGSGSTGKAAIREGFRFVGCELETEYFTIAEARIAAESERVA